MSDLIPQDLIESKPFGVILSDNEVLYFKAGAWELRTFKAGTFGISETIAAALLEHWLESQLPSSYDHYKKKGKHTLFIRTMSDDNPPIRWIPKTHNYFEADTWLDVLWQAYKAVKEIK